MSGLFRKVRKMKKEEKEIKEELKTAVLKGELSTIVAPVEELYKSTKLKMLIKEFNKNKIIY